MAYSGAYSSAYSSAQDFASRVKSLDYHQLEMQTRALIAKGSGLRKHTVKLTVGFMFLLYLYITTHTSGDFKVKKTKIYTPSEYWTSFEDISTIVAFGDSWSSQSMLLCKEHEFGAVPNPANPGFPGPYTSANGPNWIGYLANEFNRSNIQMYNLAQPGSTVTNEVVRGYLDRDLKQAVTDVTGMKNGEPAERCFWIPESFDAAHTLFTFFFGMNDIGSCVDHMGCNINFLDVDKIFDSYKKSMIDLYWKGARNFLLLNAPPTDMDVLHNTGDPTSRARHRATVKFNEALEDLAKYLRTDLQGVTVFEFDVFGMFQKMSIDLHSVPYVSVYKDMYTWCPAYDFKYLQDGNKVTAAQLASCNNLRPEEHMWNSFYHVTWPAHKAIARGSVEVMLEATKKLKKKKGN